MIYPPVRMGTTVTAPVRTAMEKANITNFLELVQPDNQWLYLFPLAVEVHA